MAKARIFDAAVADKARASADASRERAKNPKALLDAANLDLDDRARAMVLARLGRMPQSCRNTYLRAMSGRSSRTGIRAFCQMCQGHQRGPGCTIAPQPGPQYPRRGKRDSRGGFAVGNAILCPSLVSIHNSEGPQTCVSACCDRLNMVVSIHPVPNSQ
jgi:hypothetical protein